MKKIKYKDLLNFTSQLLKIANFDKFSNKTVSKGLCDTSLRGVDSHGIRLLPDYFEFALKGRKNPRPKFVFNKIFQSFGFLDANNAFGITAGAKAIDLAIPIAKKFGVSIIAVKNSSHPGAMATSTLRAANKGYAAFGFTHADALMLSYNSKEKFFGTNPISFACPRDKMEPYCLDMATTMITWNKLLLAKNNNKKLKSKYAADKNGKPTDNPFIAESLIPIGDYKGYGLASMIEVLCGVLTGMPFGKNIPPMFTYPFNKKRPIGQFYIVFRIDAVISKKKFLKRMSEMTKEVGKLRKRNKHSKIQLPNDPEIKTSKIRIKEGIPINSNLLKIFINLSKKYKIDLKIT